MENVHVFVLFPPLEHAPDQMASRPFETLSVICVPVVKDAEPVLPTATLIPAGLDVTRSPLRPVAVTVNVAVVPVGVAGVMVSVALRLAPANVAVIVTGVDVETVLVVIANVALCEPAGTVTVAGTVAALPLRDRLTTAPLPVAVALSVTVPVEPFPPVTLAGLTATDESVGAPGDAVTINEVAAHPPL